MMDDETNEFEVYREYMDVIEVIFPCYNQGDFHALNLPAGLGWWTLIWLIEHGEHLPTLYKANTLEMLLQQARQEIRMIKHRGDTP